jgi:hypothetical protein
LELILHGLCFEDGLIEWCVCLFAACNLVCKCEKKIKGVALKNKFNWLNVGMFSDAPLYLKYR